MILDQLTLTIPQAAKAVNLSPSTIRRLVAAGEIPTKRVGTRVLITRRRLEEWAAREDTTPSPSPSAKAAP